jgi:hypothetical protein
MSKFINQHFIKINLILAVVFITGISCTGDEVCRQSKYVMLEAGLYRVAVNTTNGIRTSTALSVDTITVRGIEIDSITGNEKQVDSLLYNHTLNISKIFLPLHKFINKSRYLINLNGISDTMTIYHTNYDQYLSLECGCIKIHNIDSIHTTKHFIDSIRIVVSNVNNVNAEHIHIYN